MPPPSPDAPGPPVRAPDADATARVQSLAAIDATPEAEAARVLTICNACRYCEGYCAVFPAMTRRLQFPAADVHYLANLCHSCGACLHACPYAAPHEFDVNLPRALARVRVRSYAAYAWPAAFGRLYERNGVAVALVLAWSLALFVALGLALKGRLWGAVGGANFYAVFPHQLMVWLFAPVFAFSLFALGIGARRFWRDVSDPTAAITPAALGGAAGDALRLRYLDGGHGEGCNEVDDAFTLARWRFHHLTFYGFVLCFAATCVATLYHYGLGVPAPYPLASAPVLLGTAGGIGLAIGPAGLWWLQRRRHPDHGDPALRSIDTALIALLFATSLSGLALLALRSASAMPLLLALHLGCVMALFATLPYGKFAHAVYRSAALLKWAVERRQPNPVGLRTD